MLIVMVNLSKLAICLFQLISYEEMREAQRRSEAARQRLSFVVVSVTVFASTWIFYQITRVLRRVPPHTIPDAITPPPKKIASYIFWALAIAFIAAAGYVLYLRFTEAVPSTAFLLIVAFGSLSSSLLRYSRRLATPLAEDVLATDSRKPVIFLRSFSEEESTPDVTRWGLPIAGELLEEAMLEGFNQIGPVVGLTNPRLRGRSIAYAPYDTLSADWQTRVDALLDSSAKIALVVAKTDGVSWEIRRIRDKKYLSRTIFIFPPVDAKEAMSRLEWLETELNLPSGEACSLVRAGVQPLVMRYIRDQVRVYDGSPDLIGYVESVKRALKEDAPV